MSFLKRLFGNGSKAEAPAEATGDPIAYEGFSIIPSPMPENGQFRLSALIEREIDGERRSHRLIRADVFPSKDAASEAAVQKARRLIDEQGIRLFQ
ncbi:hypothetical protein DYI37_00930 [Fulvimarina endophytica]|uniref:Transcriptional activator HlyU n=1 Tax=Fulvimarina endophytica TaxID=2293836 RepID=A0A371XBD7_9HYPH|nr:HlyU family transcriptional regulator [Fulvimarina endophytica]RFC66530.1 hypothetical protein DYI37_00930 [Fulvimarina endophytica]